MHFNLGELFCGPGGMAIASTLVEPVLSRNDEEYSISHSWGVDFAPYAIDTFKANFGEDKGICKDAWEFVKSDLTREKKINALAFGFPCNSFSQVGQFTQCIFYTANHGGLNEKVTARTKNVRDTA